MNAAYHLIEKWLPVNEVFIEAIREGGALAGCLGSRIRMLTRRRIVASALTG